MTKGIYPHKPNQLFQVGHKFIGDRNRLANYTRENGAWNKNLTKDVDERIRKGAEKMKETKRRKFASGELQIWNKNLTAKMDNRILAGEKHGNWKEVKKVTRGVPGSIRKEILKRDDNKCRVCELLEEEEDGRLEIHHIIPYSKIPEHNPDYLITVCQGCHHFIHNNDLVLGGPIQDACEIR